MSGKVKWWAASVERQEIIFPLTNFGRKSNPRFREICTTQEQLAWGSIQGDLYGGGKVFVDLYVEIYVLVVEAYTMNFQQKLFHDHTGHPVDETWAPRPNQSSSYSSSSPSSAEAAAAGTETSPCRPRPHLHPRRPHLRPRRPHLRLRRPRPPSCSRRRRRTPAPAASSSSSLSSLSSSPSRRWRWCRRLQIQNLVMKRTNRSLIRLVFSDTIRDWQKYQPIKETTLTYDPKCCLSKLKLLVDTIS